MKRLTKPFTEHPQTVGETYFEHMATAFGFGWRMVSGGLACIIHGIFPFICVKTGSSCISELHHRMVTHRDKRHRGVKTEALGKKA
ncbi:MAG: DUF6356 family protein [Pseudomonadota bacterium]